MAFHSDPNAAQPDPALVPVALTPATRSSGALPTVRLMQWIGDDEAAVDFSVLWASVVVPVASIVDWRMTVITLAPIVIRMAQRRLALRHLTHNGISPRSIQQALTWVEQHTERAPRYSGWKLVLRRLRSVGLAATAASLLANVVLTALKPWEFTTAGQTAFAWFVRASMVLTAVTVALVVADATVTPRPIFGGLRAKAHSWWRAWISKRYVAPFVQVDAYQLLAEREVEMIVANGRPR